jgi:D-alanyl-lipoteichoic acid acyltransferase DltB (MBOAT superfamily)
LTFIAYWLTPAKYRWVVLLIASYYFYMSWNTKYILLIVSTTVISYICGIFLEKNAGKKTRKYIMILGIVLSLLLLLFFKYFNFLSESVTRLLKIFSIPVNPPKFNVLLPVGISFYTFQTLSYVIDVYKGEIPAEKHLGKYAVFVSFFPQLVAGPIERSKNLLPEIKKPAVFNSAGAILGMKLIAWGFFKKLVIADNVAAYVDSVYNNVQNHTGFILIFTTVLFAFQIYCDFSGYSDIAIGVAKLFDIKLMTNFRSPYFSASLKEFWGRWHISLSTWFRDYVYVPLGGSRVSGFRKKTNLLFTFLVSGLWHGANWTFIVWGCLHGMYQEIEREAAGTGKQKRTIPWVLKVFMLFLFVCFAWIFFRANTLSDAGYIITHLFSGITHPKKYFVTVLTVFGKRDVIKGLGGIVLLLIFDYLSLKMDVFERIKTLNAAIRYTMYFGLIFIILVFMNTGSHEFVYFQF